MHTCVAKHAGGRRAQFHHRPLANPPRCLYMIALFLAEQGLETVSLPTGTGHVNRALNLSILAQHRWVLTPAGWKSGTEPNARRGGGEPRQLGPGSVAGRGRGAGTEAILPALARSTERSPGPVGWAAAAPAPSAPAWRRSPDLYHAAPQARVGPVRSLFPRRRPRPFAWRRPDAVTILHQQERPRTAKMVKLITAMTKLPWAKTAARGLAARRLSEG